MHFKNYLMDDNKIGRNSIVKKFKIFWTYCIKSRLKIPYRYREMVKKRKKITVFWLVENSVTSETVFSRSLYIGFKWNVGFASTIRFLKTAIKAMSDAKIYL